MSTILELYLDGTKIDETREFLVEFSDHHPNARLHWNRRTSEADLKQTGYRIVIREIHKKVPLLDTGLVVTGENAFSFATQSFCGTRSLTMSLTVHYGSKTVKKQVNLFNGALSSLPGQWITYCENPGKQVLRFRKDFRIRKTVEKAILYSCGLGYQNVYVNGALPLTLQQVMKGARFPQLNPAHSNYAKVCYYMVDPTFKEYLNKGDNSLEIDVAPGWRNNTTEFLTAMTAPRKIEFFGDTQLWACLEIHYKDGTVEQLATDETWETEKIGMISEIFNGETRDMTYFPEDPEIPADSDLFPTFTKIARAPGGVMRPMTLQPILMQKEYAPVDLVRLENGSYIVDFGQNMAGFARIITKEPLERGQKITVVYAEELDENGDVYTAPLRDAKQTDTYVASGTESLSGELRWQPYFTYHGFRYCRVTGLELMDRDNIRAYSLYTDVDKHSFFRCGNPTLNALHKAALMTERSNLHSIMTDCPQRDERMGWMNDATVRFEETPYNFDVSRLFPKVLRDIFSEQRENGAFTCCCPYVFGGLPADPVCSAYLMAAKQALMHCGELNSVEEFFDGMAAWENFLLSRSPDGTVDYSYYGDWAGPAYACRSEEDALNTETPGVLMSTGYSYFNCVTLADFAERLGREEDRKDFLKKAEYVRNAFLTKWFDPETGRVAGGSMGAQAFALWLGILPEEKRAAAAKIMRDDLVNRKYQFTTGNLNTRYLTDMLTEYGYVDEVYELLTKDTYPSYGFMFQNEATTVWERFELKKNPGMNSHNHPMYGAVDYWFWRYLAGIQPLEPGFKKVRIKPYFPTKLQSAQAVLDTVAGDISVRWSKRYGKIYLNVQVPEDVTAEVVFNGKTEEVTGFRVLEADL